MKDQISEKELHILAFEHIIKLTISLILLASINQNINVVMLGCFIKCGRSINSRSVVPSLAHVNATFILYQKSFSSYLLALIIFHLVILYVSCKIKCVLYVSCKIKCVCVCVCVCVGVGVGVGARACTCVCACMCVLVCVCVHTYVHVYVCGGRQKLITKLV